MAPASAALYRTTSASATKRLGSQLARWLQPGDVLALIGEMGAGKTHFVQGIAIGMKVPAGSVASPTFVLVKVYHGRLPIYHADLFRLERTPEAATVGLEEFYDEPGVTVIEWANRIPDVLPEEFLEIKFSVVNRNTRTVEFLPRGKKYEQRNWRKINRR